MIAAMEVARYLIEQAAREEEPDLLTSARLQKLLYYAQGWYLAVFGQPLFSEPIEAGLHGPVVREVLQQFRDYGNQGIEPIPGDANPLPTLETMFLAAIWQRYREHSSTKLRLMTYEESPWRTAREGAGPGKAENREIPPNVLRDDFRTRLSNNANLLIPGLSPAGVWQGTAELAQGLGTPHEQVWAELRKGV